MGCGGGGGGCLWWGCDDVRGGISEMEALILSFEGKEYGEGGNELKWDWIVQENVWEAEAIDFLSYGFRKQKY